MPVRKVLGGALAALMLSGMAASAGGLSVPLPGLPKLFGKEEQRPVQLVQAGDPRVTALEEQVRQLSGTIEELNFQILQMQEQLRKMQEDNEFRFQELEGKPAPARQGMAPAPADGQAGGTARAAEAAPGPAAPPAGGDVIVEGGQQPVTGVPPQTFGTITFDAQGNVVGGSVGDQVTSAPLAPMDQPAGQEEAGASDRTVVAALPSTDDPEELYRNAYQFILSGDYGTAETGFREHIDRFPADQRTADARFWLGEAQLGQKKYRDAAETLLAASKEFPSAKKAPDMLLKLGVALVGLDQKDVACATFAEVGKRYPQAPDVLKERVKQEQAVAAC